MTSPATASATRRTSHDGMPLDGIDHVELYVGNAAQAAAYHRSVLGFSLIAYSGLETGSRETTSYVLAQGNVRLVLTAALRPDHLVARHVARHGDSVKVVAIGVPDARHAFSHAVAGGATPVRDPWTLSDENGSVSMAQVAAYGDVVHTFVERHAFTGSFLPGFEARTAPADPVGLIDVDHVVGNVELGQMDRWVAFYERVFGMVELNKFTGEEISTEYSALMSKVVSDGSGRIKFPINEPADGLRRSQVEEFLEFNGGPGVQHLALTTSDIIATVSELRRRGIEFLRTPDSYYAELPERIGDIEEPIDVLREHGILADRDDEGYLLQVFSKPLGDRPTLFLEVIERHGAKGFGQGNFKALFQAMEREQARRGNL